MISTRSLVLSCLILALLTCATAATAAEPANIVVNGGFEEGLAGWRPADGQSLATGTDIANTGNACLTGEVTESNQHLSLRQSVQLKAGNRYQFRIAARGTNRTKLVLFLVRGAQRERVASWENLTQPWRVYSTPLSVSADGAAELEIIAPSSHGSPAGRIWIDDVALMETEMPALLSVSEDEGFNDEPAMALADDGSVYVAWNSYRDLSDSLQVARVRPPQQPGGEFAMLGQWQVVGGPGTYLLGVSAVSAGTNAYILYAAEVDGNWEVFAVECGSEGPGQPVAISRHESVDVNPAGAWQDGTLWVAWESNRNTARQIFAASLRDGRPGAAQAVSADDCSSYDPAVAALPDGNVAVAWHSFREGNYDIYLRRASAAGRWQAEQRLTRAPGVDRHAVLAAHGEELWLAYEHAVVDAYYVGRSNARQLLVAQVAADGLTAPQGLAESPLAGRCEAAAMCFDRSGRLWVSMLKPRLPRSGWDTYLTCFDGRRWQRAQPVSLQKGMDRRPSVAWIDGHVVLAFQGDSMPTSWNDVDLTPTAKSNIYLASVDATALPEAAAIRCEPLTEPGDAFEAAQLRLARGEDASTPSISYQGRKLNLYYGDLHQHSDVSVCNRLGDQSIEEDYQFSRDINRLNFACSTDHGYNINHYLWSYTSKMAPVNHDADRYLTFLAEEWTSTFEEYSAEHPYGFYGHRNLILGDTYFPRWFNARNRQTPAQVWEDLRKLDADFIHIPHQLADTGNVPTDWNFTDEQAQPVAEIFQVRGSYEYKGTPREAGRTTPPGYFLQDAWARGIVIGVIASPDHGGGYGKACVFAPELSRPAILEALRQRHCFGTTAARVFLDVRVNDHLMGEKVTEAAGGPVTVQISARCPGDIDRIEICRNNRFIYTHQPEGREAELKYVDMDPEEGRSYYYVRVIQKDEEIAWSSPVWFGAE
ncbi:MAG: CehA/McbA family metallohydrolase [Planctomycetes bacterium]|nr:CehA/McbA family metallohydrolase [Planctomycetota bacterium]